MIDKNMKQQEMVKNYPQIAREIIHNERSIFNPEALLAAGRLQGPQQKAEGPQPIPGSSKQQGSRKRNRKEDHEPPPHQRPR